MSRIGNDIELDKLAHWFRWSAIICAGFGVLLWLGPNLSRTDLFSDDAAQHVFWMYRFLDPGAFPNDLAVTYFGDSSVAPWGYHGLYYLLTRVMDPLAAAEWVAVPLLLVSVWLAWKLGCACGDATPELRGLLVVVTLLVLLRIHVTDLFTPLGLQRSFALPLTLLCLWALVAKRYAWVGVSWLVAALFYPVVLVTLGLSAAVVFFLDIVRERRLPPATLSNVAMGVAALGIAVLNMNSPPGISPTVTGAQAASMAEFMPGGRLPMFGIGVMRDWLNDHHLALGWTPFSILMILAAFGLLILLRRLYSIPTAAWVMVCVGVTTWFASRQVLFQLYLPNRHSRWTVAAFAVVLFSAAGYALLVLLSKRSSQQDESHGSGQKWSWLWAALIALFAPVIVTAALLPGAVRDYRQPVDADMENAYRFLAELPNETLVAAYPDVADFVPLRSHKSVLVSTEISLPFMLGYYNQLKPRIEASLRAAYATNVDELDASLAPYGVDVMLTNASVWSKDDYLAPFDALTHSLRQRGDALGYVLRSPPKDRILFQSGDVYVVRVGKGAGK